MAAGRFYLPAVAMYWLVEGCEAWYDWYEKMTGGRKGASRSSRKEGLLSELTKRKMIKSCCQQFDC